MSEEPISKTLWLLRYHTGREEITRETVAQFELLYAIDEAEARSLVEEWKKTIEEPFYEERLEAEPRGFTTGGKTFDGKLYLNKDRTLRKEFVVERGYDY